MFAEVMLFGRLNLSLTKILLQFGKAHAFRFACDLGPPLPHESNRIKLLLLLLYGLFSIHNK